jgi:hypothetical protein
MLVDPDKQKVVEGLTPEQIAKMEKEMEALQRDLKQIEESHGNQVLISFWHVDISPNYLRMAALHATWISITEKSSASCSRLLKVQR